jgi:hypothetical protein
MVAGSGCRKQQQLLTEGGVLKFSDDTLKFDTVFTAAGSFTTGVLIYNPQNEPVTVSSVRMQNGTASYFHLNVDGYQGNNIKNIKIAAHDSVYVFATVNINPNDTLTPFIVTDNLIATLNGKDFSMPFTAYGQNAHYIIGDSITVNTTWLTDKPYVVIHNLKIAPQTALTIPANCRVYMHQDARIIVYGGLIVDPEKKDSVVFQGDRLDRAYFGYIGYPGEWCGFWFVPGSAGLLNNTILKNCGGNAAYWAYGVQPAAIRVDTLAYLFMNRCMVKNSIGFGVFSYSGNITATSCLFHTTGSQALAVVQGGNDTFTNCTFANYGTGQLNHNSEPTVALLNYFRVSQDVIYFGNLNAMLNNCIVYGSLDSEIVCDTSVNAGGNLAINNCLLKMGSIREPFVHFSNTIFNQDPMFKDQGSGDFHLTAGSPSVPGSSSFFSGSLDLEGNPFSDGDIGCYKRP